MRSGRWDSRGSPHLRLPFMILYAQEEVRSDSFDLSVCVCFPYCGLDETPNGLALQLLTLLARPSITNQSTSLREVKLLVHCGI